MDNHYPNPQESEDDSKPEVQLGSQEEYLPPSESEPGYYINEKIRKGYERVKLWPKNAKEYYQRSPRLQKVAYQGKFLPAFWTVTAIFSVLVNILVIALLVTLGHYLFEFKTLVAGSLVNGLSENLALMDQAHIVTTVPVKTTVEMKDNLPVIFDIPLKQDSQVTLTEETVVDASTFINGAPVPLSITLPKGTPLQLNLDTTIPVSQTLPVNMTAPVSLLVPVDIAVDQTDLHQSIVGLQGAVEPYEKLMTSTFNSPKDLEICKPWWSGWMCDIIFGNK